MWKIVLKVQIEYLLLPLVLAGSFIEGLYLAIEVIETYPKDVLDADTRNLILEPLVKVVLDQEKPLLDVIGPHERLTR